MDTVGRTGSVSAVRRGTARSSRYPNFARLLGADAWARLPEAVRARFADAHTASEPVIYAGTMHRVQATRLGRLVAWLARFLGTPVAPFIGERVRTIVRVYPSSRVQGIVWERIYHFRGRAPTTVRSTKCLDRNGRLVEALGRGLRMRLTLSEDNGTLKFTSTGYCFELAGLSLPLPRWFPPGTTHVVHTDEGDGQFRFTMSTEHPWFGRMFFQEGTFAVMEKRAATHSGKYHGFFAPMFAERLLR
jgi:hypothetical protein